MRSIIKAAVRVIILIMFIMLLRIAVNNVQWVIMLPHLNIEQDIPYYTGIIGGLFIVGTVVLYFLWRKTDWLVRIIAGDLNDNELVIKTSNLDILKVAMRMFGIFLLITSIPELIGLSVYHIRLIHASDLLYSPIQQATTIMNLVSNIITIVIGAWLVIGTKGIVKVIDNVMNSPISKVKE